MKLRQPRRTTTMDAEAYAVWVGDRWIDRSPVTGAPLTYLAAVTQSANHGYTDVVFLAGGKWRPLEWPGRQVRHPLTPAEQRAEGRRNASRARARGRQRDGRLPLAVHALLFVLTCCTWPLWWLLWREGWWKARHPGYRLVRPRRGGARYVRRRR